MIAFSPKHRIFLAIESIDFRCGIDGIARVCHYQFMQDPKSGHYFVFRNKAKTAIKVLYYEPQGFCLFQKRLSHGKFMHWPRAHHSLILLTPIQIQMLINNGDPLSGEFEPEWQPLQDT